MLDDTVTSICYFNGRWGTGAVPLMTSATNAAWLANAVFDGARAFEGVAPDLDLHCQRVDAIGAGAAHEAAGHRRAGARARARGHPAVPGRRAALHPADVLGREPGWCRRGSRFHAVRAGHHEDAAARSGARDSRHACRPTAGPAPSRRPRTPRPRACIRWPAWRLPRPRRRGFDNAVMCDPARQRRRADARRT